MRRGDARPAASRAGRAVIALGLGLALVVATIGLLGLWRPRDHIGEVPIVYHASVERPVVALTFDDGPDARYTQEIIAILDHYDVRATFFVVGDQVEELPQLVRVMAEEGHEVANHTQTHPMMDELTPAEAAEEIAECSDVIASITGVRPSWYRPPRGAIGDEQADACGAEGLDIAMWTLCLESGRFETPEEFVRAVDPGDVLLLHDGRLDRSDTIDALPDIIEGLLARGYEFVTMSELNALATVR